MAEAFSHHGLLSGGWHDLAFEHFREGIEICWLVRGEPALALLRYAKGAAAPLHLHTGLETIVVLEGAQCDEHGTYESGSLIINPRGTTHSVWSPDGCVVLIQWERPVRFLEETYPSDTNA